MRHRIFNSILGFILALIMALQPAVCAYAGNSQPTEYLEDIKISYDRQKLTDAGYRLVEGNVNEGSYGNSVYIGFKTTTKKEDAITDIAIMNMNGRYSFDKYAKYLNDIKEAASEIAEQFIFTVSEFAKIYNKNPDAQLADMAYKLLNKFCDDDIVSKDYPEGTPLGVIFTDARLTTINFEDSVSEEGELEIREELTKILYQSNSENLNSIKSFLALGITETGNDTFLTRLKKIKYTSELDSALAETRQDILDGYKDVRKFLQAAEEYGKDAKAVTKAGGKVEDYIATFKKEDQPVIAAYIAVYNAAVSCQYSSNLIYDKKKLTLFDVLTLPTQDEYRQMTEEGNEPDCKYCMDAFMAEVLAKSMTKGQVGSLSAVSLVSLIINTKYSSTDLTEMFTAVYKEFCENCKDRISIYAGVDRTLFTHPEDIALTSASIDEMNKTGQNNIGRLGETYWSTHESFRKGMISATAVSAVIGVGMLVAGVAMKAIKASARKVLIQAALDTTMEVPSRVARLASGALPTASTVFCVIGAVALVISFVMMIITLAKAYEKPKSIDEYEKIEYTKIPRILVNMKEVKGEKQYYNYYCATLINASSDETDFMNIYGDLNGKDDHSQWVCLYYTKDGRCGNPLTASALVSYGKSNNSINANEYLAVHPFDSEVATSLNAYSVKSGAPLIYLYVKKTQESKQEPETKADPTPVAPSEGESEGETEAGTSENLNLGGSVFGNSSTAYCLIFFILGAVISYVVTYLTMKRKREEPVSR